MEENASLKRINIVKLATELASKKLEEEYFGLDIELTEPSKDDPEMTVYKEEYQVEFDKYYDEFYTMIENCEE